MEQIPAYINLVFILTAFLAVLLLYKAASYARSVIIMISLWLAFQAAISLSGFYTVTKGMPPRFALLLLPPMGLIAGLFLTKKGKRMIDDLDEKTLTLLHIVRIPVELTLYWLYLYKAVPRVMTFEGRNFDILCGFTAGFIYYFGYIKKVLGRKLLLAWNIACLLLLANIVVTAVLATPLPFQQWGFDQPNIALFYFPFSWLPSCIVPIVFFAHLVAMRRLISTQLIR